jgi:hypothetical protein
MKLLYGIDDSADEVSDLDIHDEESKEHREIREEA